MRKLIRWYKKQIRNARNELSGNNTCGESKWVSTCVGEWQNYFVFLFDGKVDTLKARQKEKEEE